MMQFAKDYGLRAVIVSVDYADLLTVTLPYNKHHFAEILIVTSVDDMATHLVAAENGCGTYSTNAFYKDGAQFNKWLALENALSAAGMRDGWLCLMDADVLWPKAIPDFKLFPGMLYSPLRHMMTEIQVPPPAESEWWRHAIHPNINEWAGYSQIFHARDERLGPPPWHETDWKHAGGADSFFQAKWPVSSKVRPPFKVLHLGEAGMNWCGRATPYLDGTIPNESSDRIKKLREYMAGRRGVPAELRYDKERLGKKMPPAE